MLRYDGKYEIYVVEFSEKHTREWHGLNLDYTWLSESLYQAKKSLWNEFDYSARKRGNLEWLI